MQVHESEDNAVHDIQECPVIRKRASRWPLQVLLVTLLAEAALLIVFAVFLPSLVTIISVIVFVVWDVILCVILHFVRKTTVEFCREQQQHFEISLDDVERLNVVSMGEFDEEAYLQFQYNDRRDSYTYTVALNKRELISFVDYINSWLREQMQSRAIRIRNRPSNFLTSSQSSSFTSFTFSHGEGRASGIITQGIDNQQERNIEMERNTAFNRNYQPPHTISKQQSIGRSVQIQSQVQISPKYKTQPPVTILPLPHPSQPGELGWKNYGEFISNIESKQEDNSRDDNNDLNTKNNKHIIQKRLSLDNIPSSSLLSTPPVSHLLPKKPVAIHSVVMSGLGLVPSPTDSNIQGDQIDEQNQNNNKRFAQNENERIKQNFHIHNNNIVGVTASPLFEKFGYYINQNPQKSTSQI
ncbi:MAG: hypothetical protein EZS28_016417 [Streblomastix strix]|uniref:Uncharacterized protein n=1 Tax=Streblomastix strix TaxID=222440 RepID=A0A5J4VZG6_9EUKA|nr:MAG: hypothetical protein EZS28_016417 [Streblomastix strix]